MPGYIRRILEYEIIFNVIEDFYILFVSVKVRRKQTETYQRVLQESDQTFSRKNQYVSNDAFMAVTQASVTRNIKARHN